MSLTHFHAEISKLSFAYKATDTRSYLIIASRVSQNSNPSFYSTRTLLPCFQNVLVKVDPCGFWFPSKTRWRYQGSLILFPVFPQQCWSICYKRWFYHNHCPLYWPGTWCVFNYARPCPASVARYWRDRWSRFRVPLGTSYLLVILERT
jgi:hypothetical protein